MDVLPNEQILAIWQATVEASMVDGRWTWGGRDGSDSLSDAEQLLCLLTPATALEWLAVDQPEQTSDAALDALQQLGDAAEIPRAIVALLADYFARHVDEAGDPAFTADGYLSTAGPVPAPEQRPLAVVTSYTTAVKLCLAALGFVRVFRQSVRRDELRAEIDTVDRRASARLSAAMIGLLRSFCMHTFTADGAQGQIQCATLTQDDSPDVDVVLRLRQALREVIAASAEMTIGSGQAVDLDNPDRLFECGWSWGIVTDAPAVDTTERIGTQPEGVAVDAPYVHFTVAAMNAIEQLFSERTRILGLLNEEQARLSRALQLRWEVARGYWSQIALFGEGAWPLEDPPWRTTDGEESDYFSLLVSYIVLQHITVSRDASADDWSRIVSILVELAGRGRITRRPLAGDPALEYHSPGRRLLLSGSETVDNGPTLSWTLNDYAPMLMECAARALESVQTITDRRRLSRLIDQIWRHLDRRRIRTGPARGLWDQPGQVYPSLDTADDRPSWFYTSRVVEGLVGTAHAIARVPPTSDALAALAAQLLAEAEYLYDQQMLRTAGHASLTAPVAQTLTQSTATLNLARRLAVERPGSASGLALEALRDLARLHQSQRADTRE